MPIETSSLQETHDLMQRQLGHLLPDAEIAYKAELVYAINRLKKERHALILGHNYMEPALFYAVADIVGDSLALSRQAAEARCERIVFCGVRFMAETAKILNPARMVLLPAARAGCSLAESIRAEDVRALRKQFPQIPIVSYINTYADVKAESDIICTSGNAVRVVQSLESDAVIFLPDEYLARYVASQTQKRVLLLTPKGLQEIEETDPTLPPPSHPPDASALYAWHGRCEVHELFRVEDIALARQQHPDVLVLAHPECSPEVIAASDFTGSTTALANYIEKSEAKRFLLLTECSMGDNIIAMNPQKEMLRQCHLRCPHMAEITLEDTLATLREDRYLIEVPKEIATRARGALERMLTIPPTR
jgi:quinolinate synthase